MSVYIAVGDRETASEAAEALCAAGLDNYLETGAVESELTETEFLVLALSDVGQLPRAESAWRFFLNEIAWKRKHAGEIVLYSREALPPAKLPFKLRGCKLFRTPEALVSYLQSADQPRTRTENPDTEQSATAEQVKLTRVEPPRQIQYSHRAETPAAPQKASPENRSGACKEDHVFEAEDSWWNADNRQKSHADMSKRRSTTFGCLFSALIAIVGIVIFIVNMIRIF